MFQSIRTSIFSLAFVAGCSPSLQVGLANAPWLGGDTPETRVHDEIANGHDACERSAFPPGGVLRGQIPPCAVEKSVTVSTLLVPEPIVSRGRTWVMPRHGLGVCESAGPGLTRTEMSVPGISVLPGEIVCDEPW